MTDIELAIMKNPELGQSHSKCPWRNDAVGHFLSAIILQKCKFACQNYFAKSNC